jgi:predicted dehydrogenase
MGVHDDLTRRDFLQKTAIATAAVAIPSGVFAAGSDQIKVGLIGCGGRGSGAIYDALTAEPSVVLYAMGDAFPDRLAGSRANVLKDWKDRCLVTDDRAFVGFDAYQKVLAQPVDVVILATPPGFRPIHFAAAIEAGKHVFMEKPVATDAPGIRAVIEAATKAKAKGLNVVTGTQRRHDLAYKEAMKRIADGQIGDVVATYVYWNQGGLWMNPRQGNWSDMEWQLRNWLYFTWLSGDHICEQHIHNLDVGNWAMGGKHPAKALSLAGRQVRTDPAYGHIFDHFATEYEYDNGVKMMSMCRQIDGTASRVSELIVGTKGTSNGNTYIKGEKPWQWSGDRPNPYMLEHKDLYAAIKSGKYVNEGVRVAESTLTAIMGRMSAYTGQEVTWEQALNSQESLFPAKVEFGPLSVPAVAVPGQTKLK